MTSISSNHKDKHNKGNFEFGLNFSFIYELY